MNISQAMLRRLLPDLSHQLPDQFNLSQLPIPHQELLHPLLNIMFNNNSSNSSHNTKFLNNNNNNNNMRLRQVKDEALVFLIN